MAAENRTLLYFLTGIASASLVGLAAFDMPIWFIDLSKLWGPAFLLLAFGAVGIVHYIPRSVIGDFVTAQQNQAIAMSSISQSLHEISGQGGVLQDLKDILLEIRLDQKVMADRLRHMEERRAHE